MRRRISVPLVRGADGSPAPGPDSGHPAAL